MSNDLEDNSKMFLDVCLTWYFETKTAIIYIFQCKDGFFSKIYVFNNLVVVKKRSRNLHHSCQSTLWSLTKIYSMSAIVGNTKKGQYLL